MPKERLLLKLVDDRERIDTFLDKLLNLHTSGEQEISVAFLMHWCSNPGSHSFDRRRW
jgi:hypothetical protein